MTIAVSVKINDGVVLASDSATTILGQTGPGTPLVALNVYNNANKIFNLCKGLPIGAITWGAGSIGQASISTVIKNLRERFAGNDPEFKSWKLNSKTYTIFDVADQLRKFIFNELYESAYKNFQFPKPSMGFIVAGYSANAPMADEFQIDIQNGVCTGPRQLRKQEESGVTWSGEPEALNRLILGRSGRLQSLLEAQLGVNSAQMNQAMMNVQAQIQQPLLLPAMPLQDAIDLGAFMVDVTKKFSRFSPGAPTVGGPVEIAAISKHEGFRWIRRKYYFKHELNSPDRYFEDRGKPDDKSGKEEGNG